MKAEQTSNLTRIGVITVSDRASRGQYEDLGGPAILRYLAEVVASKYDTVSRVIADEPERIRQTLIELCDQARCHLIVTTGGTGPARRDVTPESTLAVCDREMPGFGELMRSVSLKQVPTAILSCQTAGVRFTDGHGSLIVNLPGNPQSIAECLDAVFPAIPYCLDLINPEGPRLETNPERLKAFRKH
jgi:molybdopterin adenylyltransferase